MDLVLIKQELQALNPYEQIGKKYYDTFHTEMDFAQLQYLMEHPHLAKPLQELGKKSTLKKLENFRFQFHQSYAEQGLTEQDFFPDDKDIVLQPLCRYVHIPKHKHSFVEFVFVGRGECTHIIDAYTAIHHSGDFTIIPPGVSHELHASPDSICITAKVRSSTLLDVFPTILRENSILSTYFSQMLNLPNYHSALLLHCGEDEFPAALILFMYALQKENKLYCNTFIESLWQVFFSHILQNYQESAEFLLSETVHHAKLFDILNYIFENYRTITLEETAHHFYISAPYLSAKIHELTGQTFSRLLRDYKLKQAANLLTRTNLKIEEICDEIGYRDTAQFIRTFKKEYSCTPLAYRKKTAGLS